MSKTKVDAQSNQPSAPAQTTECAAVLPILQSVLAQQFMYCVETMGSVGPRAQTVGAMPRHLGNARTGETLGLSIHFNSTVREHQNHDHSHDAVSAAPIQRLVAREPGPRVYAPRSIRKFARTGYAAATYLAELQVLLGGNPQIVDGQLLKTKLGTAGVAQNEGQTI